MSHEQLLSRNKVEFAELVQIFHELNSVYNNQYSLYLDMDYWELFDLRVARPIIRHEFKHFNQFTSDMKRLYHSILMTASANIRCNRYQKPKNNEIWHIKHIIKLYTLSDSYFFGTNLRKYMSYGFN